MVLNFTEFLLEEARLSDILTNVKFSGDKNTYDLIINARNKKFTEDVEFIKSCIIPDFGHLKINWYDLKEHLIIDRIKRTNLKSISEFNAIIEYSLKSIIPSKMDEIKNGERKYAIHLKDNAFHIVVGLSKLKLLSNHPSVKIITILKNSDVTGVVKTFEVDDTEFI